MDYKQFNKLKERKDVGTTLKEIIKLLKQRPHYTKELAEKLELDVSTISYYLKRLEIKGQIIAKRVNKNVYYGLIENDIE